MRPVADHGWGASKSRDPVEEGGQSRRALRKRVTTWNKVGLRLRLVVWPSKRLCEESGVGVQHLHVHGARCALRIREHAGGGQAERGALGTLLLLAVVIAWEHIVCDLMEDDYVRVQIGEALDGHEVQQRARERTLTMEPHGLQGELRKSKTSGAGKKTSVFGIFVSRQAWLAKENWLEQGRQLWALRPA